jgi:SAM-dependent methyltransferase
VHWVAKAVGAKVVGALPGGDGLHYALQRRVTRTLPVGRRVFRKQRRRAVAHLRAYEQHGPERPLGEAVFYEFGAGWDLTVPLVYWSLGVNHQVLVDLRQNVRLELVNHTLGRLRGSRAALRRVAGRRVRPVGPPLGSLAELEPRFGIRYIAPSDARATGLPSESVDFVSSTSTLEHVPEPDIVPILAECRRLLRPDGVLSARIDMRDHFSYDDRRVSPYAFLRYSPRAWALLNSRLLFQNRLRLPDYLRAFEEAELELVSVESRRPRLKGRQALRRLDLAFPFREYAFDDLAAQTAFVVARPRVLSPHSG